MNEGSDNRCCRGWLWNWIIFGITFAVFSPALSHELLQWDDSMFIVNNPQIRSLDWDHIRVLWTTTEVGAYTPVSRLSYAIDYAIWGAEPFGYHLSAILLHACNAVFVFWIARRLFERSLPGMMGIRWSAFFTAMVFALHPLRVESVVWASERRDMLSGFFGLLSTLAYLTHVRTEGDPSRRMPWYVLSFSAFVLGCFSKTVLVTLPLVFLILDIYPFRRIKVNDRFSLSSTARVLFEKVPFLFFSAALGFMTMHILISKKLAFSSADYGWGRRVGQSLVANLVYLRNFVWPAQLNPLDKLLEIYDFWKPIVWKALGANLLLFFIPLLLRRRYPAFLAGWLCYGVVILPLLGVAQSGYQLTADRYTYFSMIPFALLIGGGWGILLSGWKPRGMGFVLMVLVLFLISGSLALKTARQIGFWRNQETFSRQALHVNPRNPLAWVTLGEGLTLEGRAAEATEAYQRALELCPYTNEPWNSNARFNIAAALVQRGETNSAIHELKRAVHITPTYSDGHLFLGNLLFNQKKYLEASRHFFATLSEGYRTDTIVNLGLCAGAMNHLGIMLKSFSNAAMQNDPRAFVVWANVFAANHEYSQARGLLLVGLRMTQGQGIRKRYLELVHEDPNLSTSEREKAIADLKVLMVPSHL